MNRLQHYYDNVYYGEARHKCLLSHLMSAYSLDDRLAVFQRHCLAKGNARVLDFGCGSGAILTGLNGIDRAGSWGLDVSLPAIEYARQGFPDYNWRQVEVDGAIPFEDHSFDVAISSEVIEHVFDVDFFLGELHRVLVPGGILGLSFPHHGWLKDLAIVLSGNAERHFHNPDDPHIRFYSMRSIGTVLERNSFEILSTVGICPYFRLSPLSRMMAVVARRD